MPETCLNYNPCFNGVAADSNSVDHLTGKDLCALLFLIFWKPNKQRA